MPMKQKPYIGVTGVTTKEEVKSAVEAFAEAGFSMASSHIPSLGYLVSYKTLNAMPHDNRRYPLFIDLPILLNAAGNNVQTMIHYNSREMDTLADQVSKIFQGIYDQGLCKAMQLNIVWPDDNQVEKIRKRFPDMKIVLQLSDRAMYDKSIETICSKVTLYKGLADYVLIDPSGGRSKEFLMSNSLEIYYGLIEYGFTIGFAGGFTGGNVKEKLKMLKEMIGTNEFSIDAEGGLRDKRISDKYGDDDFNIEKVKKYLKEASIIL